ncbi:nonmuscle myosin heavy chain b [Heliocybe sulcata]|uniref:Nonmuscle myosin heavy chain b n=1 Tax=Heliocybe sulcata TaxID=5364 RepID=A0A5C3MPJ1_9AGAM|nr:nonmuscle myosin heavy chain b [Heliocybe sulcata]
MRVGGDPLSTIVVYDGDDGQCSSCSDLTAYDSMPPARISQGAEAARAAALQAEFNEKKWVWVPDEKEGYLAGWVVNEQEDMGEIVMASGGEIRRVPLYALSKMNPPKFDRVDDIADLTFLNEASVVHNLRLRYGSGAIYTYSGLFLVAINPYQSLPLYTDMIIQQYRGKRKDENPPHIFAIAERAWISMGEERENQSILITGESGAGKTESTKKVIQYLAAIATDTHLPTPSHSQSPSLSGSNSFGPAIPPNGLPRSSSFKSGSQILNSKGRLGLLERQILQANPILEAFGNAQTQRNNNSSRFGKFIRISFSPDGSIAGANIDWYLLEKSRVVGRSEAERSFHVFYQLLEAGGALKETLLLDGGVEDYEYLNKSRREVDGVNDVEEWKQLQAAFETVGFSPAEQFDLFRIVAAILHIGNITITSTRADDAVMPDPSQAERVCHLLGIPVAEFMKAVLRPKVLAGREWVTQARTRQQAIEELGALCKTLYEKSFGQLVERINKALDRPSSKSTFIGVLDIAGFEIFEVNGYEQLLINFTNEKLQQFFNHHMFVLEQEEYARESIEWDYVNFGLDLQPTIDLIEASGSTIGILSCLDEECIMPKATDVTFTHKLHTLWAGETEEEEPHPARFKYEPTRFEQGFLIQHYAGKVEYRTDSWLEKNKDPLNDNLTRVLAASGEKYVSGLFADYVDLAVLPTGGQTTATLGKKRTLKKGAFRTVAQRHKEQLASLMSQLHATQPHFVRCIVPNNNKKPARIDVPLVLDQLRCNGVLEGIRIARLGYPNRLPFIEFRQRYEVLTPGIIPPGYMDGRKACLRMVDALELEKSIYKIGTSKIFFKAGVLAELEERRDALLYDIFSRLQAVARKWTARRQMKKILNRAVAIRVIQRNARVYGELREWPWWQLYTKVRPLLAATRNDEELRKKELELLLAREKAERDEQERKALDNLRMSLEQEKKKVEDSLEAERALGLDKDALLERSKNREAELEEEVAALQHDLDTLDSQLDRALKIQRESEEKHEALKQAFDQAAEHLVRLESEQKEWAAAEADLVEQLTAAHGEIDTLRQERDQLVKVNDDLERSLGQGQEDLTRLRERSETAIAELEEKLAVETRNRDLVRSKSEEIEQESRHAREQLAELTRTATEYSNLITKKDDEIAQLLQDLDTARQERSQSAKRISELQGQIDTLAAELQSHKDDQSRDADARQQLQTELDELRSLVEAKVSEEIQRAEVEKNKEEELGRLRDHVAKLREDLTDARKIAVEGQNKLRVDLDNSVREHQALLETHQALLEKSQANAVQLKTAEAALADMEKSKRSLENELQSVRSRQIDSDAAQTRHQDFEDTILQFERDKSSQDRQLETTRKELDAESAKRAKLEKSVSSQKAELARLKDRNIKLDRELNKALTDLKAREWEVKQLESRQDKTIVEHVHVLEEAKRVTDRQLAEAQLELQKNQAYIRSLEKTRSRLAGEAEDLVRVTELERVELKSKERAAKLQEEKAARALAEVDKERRARETAELQLRRLQSELQDTHSRAEDLQHQLVTVQRSKDNLESELTRLADETVAPNSMAKMQRQYEAQIAELEHKLEEAHSLDASSAKIKDYIDRHHADIRRLITESDPQDESFRSRLLEELQSADDQLYREIFDRSARVRATRTSDVRSYSNVSPKKRMSNGTPIHPMTTGDVPRAPDKQVNALRQHVQVLELRIAVSDRVRQHLESSLRELTADLESSDGSVESLQQYRARLARENARLAELLREEAEARQSAESTQIDNVQALWTQFQGTISQERESYDRLEESRKALMVQQRTTQVELENSRRQIEDLAQSKKQLQAEVASLKDRITEEVQTKQAEAGRRRQLEMQLKELELSSDASGGLIAELKEAVDLYKSKADAHRAKLDEAEITRAKALQSESLALARRSLAELEKSYADAVAERKAFEGRLQSADERIRELEAHLEDEGRESYDLELLRQRLAEEMEEERKQYQKDLSDRDFATDQTRKKYQTELAQLSEELQAQRDSMSRLREENRRLRSDYDELQLRYDDEVYSGGAWKKEKERLETKIGDLSKAYEVATAAQSEQQSQIVALHSQVRELRGVLNDAEADRALLQKARRALQAELDAIKMEGMDTGRMSSDTEMQRLQLEKQDLERALEEQQDRAGMAFERMKKAEAHANECQMELGKVRVENSELDKLNATLEKQIKDLNVRVVDLETKSLASSPRPPTTSRRMESRIQELTDQLNQSSKDKSESLRLHRSADKTARDAKYQLAELERQRQRLEEENQAYEGKLASLRQVMDELQTSESNLQLAKRRAEREAADYKQKTLSLEREIDRLRNRLDRPSAVLPTGSPRR